MSIVIASKTQRGRADAPALATRGIKGYTQTQFSHVHPVAIPTKEQPAYGQYAHNISMYIAATNRKTKLLVLANGAKLDLQGGEMFPFPLPRLAYKPKQPFSDDEEAAFMNSTQRFSPEVVAIGKDRKYVFKQPSLGLMESLAPSCSPRMNSAEEEIFPFCFQSLRVLGCIAAAFLATHTYASYQEDAPSTGAPDESESDEDMDVDQAKQWTEFRSSVEMTVQIYGKSINSIASTDDICESLRTSWDAGTASDYDSLKEILKKKPIDSNAAMEIDARDLSPVARPSKDNMFVNVGAIPSVPKNAAGRFFPYVQRMSAPDYTTLRNIFFTHFRRNLGETDEEIDQGIKAMRSTIEHIASTTLGELISHVFIGIHLAITSQTRLFAVMENDQYLGFCLLGRHFRVLIHGSTLGPLPPQKFSASLGSLSSHTRSIEEIAKWLSSMPLRSESTDANGEKEYAEVPLTTLTSSYRVFQELALREVSDKDMKTNFTPLSANLAFKSRFRTISPFHIKELLAALLDDTITEPSQDYGLHILLQPAKMDSKLGLLLAQFGPEAPSPISTKGNNQSIGQVASVERQIPNPELKKRKKVPTIKARVEGVEEGDRFDKIVFSRKPLLSAITDWNTFFKTKNMVFNPLERAAASRTLVITGDLKDELQCMMSKVAYKYSESKAAGKKRARDIEDDEDATEEVRKKAKTDLFTVLSSL